MPLLERLELAFAVPPARSDTQLVWCDESNRGVSFGFTDVVVHTGDLLFASLLRGRAARQLAELTSKSQYLDIAETIRRAVPVVFAHPGGCSARALALAASPMCGAPSLACLSASYCRISSEWRTAIHRARIALLRKIYSKIFLAKYSKTLHYHITPS